MSQDFALALISFVISVLALYYSRRATNAAERQAKAAEDQALAIPAQLAAAEASADAAKQQAAIAIRAAEETRKSARLAETELKASLRPILEFERRPPDLRDPVDYLVNKGKGFALKIAANYGTNIPPTISAPSTLPAGGETRVRADWSRVPIEAICLLYESEDGRRFRTMVGLNSSTGHPIHHHEEIG